MKPVALGLLALSLVFSGCQKKAEAPKPLKVGVFIPGIRAGNAIYDTMASGIEKAVAETSGASVKIYEAGFNQAEWEERLTSLVATGEYDLIVTSNPSMPELCAKVGKSFPTQKFLCLDGYISDNPQIASVLYNQTEQGYVTGYLAGLVTTAPMPFANKDRKVGLLIAQHYPVMDKVIIPGFELGLAAVDPSIALDLRVLGNFYDAAKAADIAKSMVAAGCDLILPIAGGANEGVYKNAQAGKSYVVVFDGNDFARAPSNILACTVLHQETLAYVKVKAAFEGSLAYGKAQIVGMKEGYIEFLDKDQSYISNVPAELRNKMADLVTRIKGGKLVLAVPRF